ncbi:MAG: YccF domain-containing protein [Kiritimatiellae bacterium]|nr:YccF domain-containing protein [Kiritimatiellia bacterium]
MAVLGNILWFLLGGLWMGLEWLITGLFFCLTIIGIPYGIACFRIAQFAFFPFGKMVVPSENAGACTFLLNVIWVIFAGLWLWISAVIAGLFFCVTIIGIPFGIACFRIAKVSFAPLGKKVVSLP